MASSTRDSAETQKDTWTRVDPAPAAGGPGHQDGAESAISAGPRRFAIRPARAATPSADPSSSTPTRIGPPGAGRLSSTAEATRGEFAAAATASQATDTA